MRLPAYAALLLAASTICHAEGSDAARAAFDGRWWVELVCADTQDRSGLVKGYVFAFPVTIVDGRLAGEYGVQGAPSSVAFEGTVAGDGALEIKAVGHTGRVDYSVGEVPKGTRYAYTMGGRLDGTRGQATRREVRPCTASFSRQ